MNKLTFCPDCGQRGLEREFSDGTIIFLHGKNGKWEKTCNIVDNEGNGKYKKVHNGRWALAKV